MEEMDDIFQNSPLMSSPHIATVGIETVPITCDNSIANMEAERLTLHMESEGNGSKTQHKRMKEKKKEETLLEIKKHYYEEKLKENGRKREYMENYLKEREESKEKRHRELLEIMKKS